jgi:hypothetical protein
VPSVVRSTSIVALTILIAAILAAPAVASAATPVVPPPASRFGDEIHIPGVTSTFARNGTNVKRTAGAGGASSVELVYVSVASVTSSASDDVNSGMSESAIQTLISQLDSFWSAQSGGAVSIQLGGYETRSLGQASCSPNAVLTTEEGKAFGGQFAGNSWIGSNQHLMVLTKEACGHQSFATVGGNGGEIFSGNGVSTDLGMPYLLHEFGHNLGFEHADASVCENTGSLDASIANFGFSSTTCPTTEYDDYLDIMGYTVKGATPNLSSPQRIIAGWLTDYATATAAAGSRTFVLSALSGATGTRALKVTDPISGQAYYVEYRTPQGLDKTSAEFRYANQCGTSHGGYEICNLGSESGGASVTVSFDLPSTTSTALALDKLTQTYGSGGPATAHVTVQPARTGTAPDGSVSFYDGSSKLSTVALDPAGKANYPLPSTLAVGKHSITARFIPGSSDLLGSTSSATSVTVAKIASQVSFSLKSASVSKGHHESVTVTVSANGVTAPSGTLTAYVNGKSVGTHTLPTSHAGVLTFSLPAFTSKGTKRISVSYHGTSHIAPSKSATSSMRAV